MEEGCRWGSLGNCLEESWLPLLANSLSTRDEEWGVRIQCLLVSVAWVITGLQDAEKPVGGFFNKSTKVLKLTVFKRLMPVSKQHPLILESQPLGLIGSLSFHFS